MNVKSASIVTIQLFSARDSSDLFMTERSSSGKNTKTGGRLLRLKKYLIKEKTFMLTYGDGVSSVNIKKIIKFDCDF